jgi:hypothetical protein
MERSSMVALPSGLAMWRPEDAHAPGLDGVDWTYATHPFTGEPPGLGSGNATGYAGLEDGIAEPDVAWMPDGTAAAVPVGVGWALGATPEQPTASSTMRAMARRTVLRAMSR